MSCFGCSKKYGLFTKEHGCPNCGYSYCVKCLKRPMPVPRQGGKVLNVCLICYDKLSKLQATEKVIDIDALPGVLVTKSKVHRGTEPLVAAAAALLEDDPPPDLGVVLAPTSSASIIATEATHSSIDNTEIEENLDSVISKRLKDLKTIENPSTDEEIRTRLATLNGMPQKDYSKKDLLLSTDERTDQQKMQDLLEQFMGETQIDRQVESERKDAISDIERRLAALREHPVDGASILGAGGVQKEHSPDNNTPSDNEDDEAVLKAVMQKYLTEARLPAAPTDLEAELASGVPPPPAGTRPADLEELPWCNICNEDAVFRCKGCDGELFCAQCFRECHNDDEEYRAHEKVLYSAPPKFKENHF
ncbi:abscission/NoCut checkpoint regulator [Ceratitis capitata]|uniref:Zinc finger FYVE domain-containing protein 19 n=1 Tax=Ceratitis capitata TaxID=7213 RepID=W8BU59_CERCA|nr:abscission/NoCut checkpoint regulator [Ceratitis capitata]